MKRLCKNCGAKIPAKSDICKKCGTKFISIEEELDLDEETAERLKVEKPSNMIHICLLLLAIVVFLYSLLLLYLDFTGKRNKEEKNLPADSSATSEISLPEESTKQEEPSGTAFYNAIEFIGKPFSEVKAVLGEQYGIKLIDDVTQVTYIDYPLTFIINENNLSNDAIVASMILKNNAQIDLQVRANMTFTELAGFLNFNCPAPVFNETDSFYYAYKIFENDSYHIKASFKFDDDSTDQPPLEVLLVCEELNIEKVYGTVTDVDDEGLNVREEPFGETLGTLLNGNVVEILDEVTFEDEDGNTSVWYEIKKDDLTGYSIAEYILKDGEKNKSDENSEEDKSSEEDENSEEDTDEETED